MKSLDFPGLGTGIVALTLLALAPAPSARAQDVATPVQQVAFYDDDDLEDYFEDLREAREEYYEDLRDAQRRAYKRAWKHGVYPVIPYTPYYPRTRVVVPQPVPVVPYGYAEPVPYYGAPYYDYGSSGGVSIPLGPFGGINVRW